MRIERKCRFTLVKNEFSCHSFARPIETAIVGEHLGSPRWDETYREWKQTWTDQAVVSHGPQSLRIHFEYIYCTLFIIILQYTISYTHIQGLVNVLIEHHPTLGDIISNKYGWKWCSKSLDIYQLHSEHSWPRHCSQSGRRGTWPRWCHTRWEVTPPPKKWNFHKDFEGFSMFLY